MIKDKQLYFSEEQAITATAASTNYMDMAQAVDLGQGAKLVVIAEVTEAFTDGSSNSTVSVTVETDDNSSFSSATEVASLGTFAALSAVGDTLAAALLPGGVERYIRLKYTVANGDLSTGKITAQITPFEYQGLIVPAVYADAVTIS